jgi:hypothetical protein
MPYITRADAQRLERMNANTQKIYDAAKDVLANAVWNGKMGLKGISDAEALVPHPVLEHLRSIINDIDGYHPV